MKLILILFLGLLLQLSCRTHKINGSTHVSTPNELIKDCPEELISNQMPSIGKENVPQQYYIYKGIRKEISEFDSIWVRENCKVEVIIVH